MSEHTTTPAQTDAGAGDRPVANGTDPGFANLPTSDFANHPQPSTPQNSANGGGGRVIDFPNRPTPGRVIEGEVFDDDGTPILVDPPAPPRRRRDPLIAPWADTPVERRPVIAPWLRSRSDITAGARWLAGLVWHMTGFHTVRLPIYGARLAAWSPRGLGVAVTRTARWLIDHDSKQVAIQAARSADADRYLKLMDARSDRVRLRLRLAFTGLLIGGGGLFVLDSWAPVWVLWLLGGLAVMGLGWLGSPADRPITGPSVKVDKPTRLTSDVVVRALGALGIAEINKALAKGPGISFPAPITRDGPGWRAEVDLPYGVTAVDVIERRESLASGLRRPLGCVWPEPADDSHAGRLVLWVGDQDMSQAKPTHWPLAKHGRADLFKPIPFGTNPRGRIVTISLVFANVLIGAMPRVGKTFALRVLLLAAALDAGVELRIFELKGTGDLSMLEGCCHRYASGADDTTLEQAMESLRELYAELLRRAKVISKLPREVCPENKVTPELAARRSLGLWLVTLAIDECQELFSHPDFKDEAARLAEGIIKRGPAMGIILILATQRPDAKSLPTGVSANVGIRFCLRVMGQTENDMVLGTSSYKNGLRATVFGPRDKGIGYLVGAGDSPEIARSAYIDGPGAEAIAARARGLREKAGTLTGHAAGETTTSSDGPTRSILSDLAVAFAGGEDRLWSETILERLAEQWPSVYRDWTKTSLAAALKPYGVKPGDVWGTTADGQSTTRRGYLRADIVEALNAQRRDTGGDSA
ncbi:MAG TPA: FtsK/SpoIIIE domain-containing protein [Pseudonocardia sp.]|jgi:S-DNA-T family DNA segregation ATPase FtsK/SpoIIIE|nr:FtsK/SpoIIIE domain-containing protein [Pseudonocardia sp.]